MILSKRERKRSAQESHSRRLTYQSLQLDSLPLYISSRSPAHYEAAEERAHSIDLTTCQHDSSNSAPTNRGIFATSQPRIRTRNTQVGPRGAKEEIMNRRRYLHLVQKSRACPPMVFDGLSRNELPKANQKALYCVIARSLLSPSVTLATHKLLSQRMRHSLNCPTETSI